MAEKKIGFLTDEAGNPSIGRLNSTMATLGGMAIGTMAAITAAVNKTDMTPNTVNFCLGIIGIGIVGKGVQKFAERKK